MKDDIDIGLPLPDIVDRILLPRGRAKATSGSHLANLVDSTLIVDVISDSTTAVP